jgi:hypothetical protein
MVSPHICSFWSTLVYCNPTCIWNGPSPASSFSEAAHSTRECKMKFNMKTAFNDWGRGYFGIPGSLESSSWVRLTFRFHFHLWRTPLCNGFFLSLYVSMVHSPLLLLLDRWWTESRDSVDWRMLKGLWLNWRWLRTVSRWRLCEGGMEFILWLQCWYYWCRSQIATKVE